MADNRIFPVLVDTIDAADDGATDAGTEVAFQAVCSNPECSWTGEARPTFDADAADHTATC